MADTAHTDVPYIMKRRYSDRFSTEVATRDHPSFFEVPKEAGSIDGSDFRYPVTTGNPQSIGSVFATAQGQAGTNASLKGVVFAAEPKLKYGVLKLDGPSLLRAPGGKGSFFDFFTRHVDGMLEELGADIAFDLHRDGNGIRGRRSSISGNVVTLSGARTADKFKRGMTVGASANSDGSSPRTGTTYVTAVDRASNKITLNSAAAIASFSDGDYLFRPDDPGNCIDGWMDHTPLAAPTSGDSFRGVDRSVDVESLAGSRIDNTALYPEQIIGDLAVDIKTIGKKVSRALLYPTKFQDMVNRLGAKVNYANPGGHADIGFETITIVTAAGSVMVISDPDAPTDLLRVYDQKSHALKYLGGELVHWIKNNGSGLSQWSTTTDGIEMRSRFYGNYLQYDPSSQGVGSVA